MHVWSYTLVPVECYTEFTVEETSVETKVKRSNLFPSQSSRSYCRSTQAEQVHTIYYPTRSTRCHSRNKGIGSHVLVTDCTPRTTELQVAHCRLRPIHEAFFRSSPTSRERWEETELLTFREHRRTVVTYVSFQQVLAHEVIVYTTEETYCSKLIVIVVWATVCTRIFFISCQTDFWQWSRNHTTTFRIVTQLGTAFSIETTHNLEVMLVFQIEAISSICLEYIIHRILASADNLVMRRAVYVRVPSSQRRTYEHIPRLYDTTGTVLVLIIQCKCIVEVDIQALDRSNGSTQVRTYIVACSGFAVSLLDFSYSRTDVLTFILSVRIPTRPAHQVVPYVCITWSILVRFRVYRTSEENVGTNLPPVADLSSDVAVQCVTVILVGIECHHTFLLHVTQWNVESSLVRTTSYREIMVLLWSPLLGKFVYSVERTIPISLTVDDFNVTTQLDVTQFLLRHATVLVFPSLETTDVVLVYVETYRWARGLTLTAQYFHDELGIVYSRSQFRKFGWRLPCKVVRVRKTHLFVGLTLLGRNQDYTPCSTSTVDRRWSGILQYWDWFDVIRINEVQVWNFHVIHENQRSVGCSSIQWTVRTTELDVWWCTYTTLVVSNRKTWRHTLQRLGNIGYRTASNRIFHVYVCYGTSQVSLLLSTITYYNDFFQKFIVVFQNNAGILGYLYFLSLITHERNLNSRTRLDVQSSLTVEVSNCTVGGTLLNNVRTDNRFALWINNCNGNVGSLLLFHSNRSLSCVSHHRTAT